MSKVLSFSSGREDRARVRDVVVQSMADDPVAKYLAKEGRLAPFYDGLMSPYWSSKPRDLHLMTKGCKAVVFARFHPQEEASLSLCAHHLLPWPAGFDSSGRQPQTESVLELGLCMLQSFLFTPDRT